MKKIQVIVWKFGDTERLEGPNSEVCLKMKKRCMQYDKSQLKDEDDDIGSPPKIKFTNDL